MNDEVPFLELRQEGASEERQGGATDQGKDQGSGDRGSRARNDATQHSFVTVTGQSHYGRVTIMSRGSCRIAPPLPTSEKQHAQCRRDGTRHEKRFEDR